MVKEMAAVYICGGMGTFIPDAGAGGISMGKEVSLGQKVTGNLSSILNIHAKHERYSSFLLKKSTHKFQILN